MKALHFGAGNIGRGFIGKLLADAGIQLTFADVNQVVLDALNARHSYQVHVVGETEQVDTVSGVTSNFHLDPSSMQLGSNVPFPRQLTVTRDGDIMILRTPIISESYSPDESPSSDANPAAGAATVYS